MTYSIPVALSLLAQLRAWASLKTDDLPGCALNKAVLKFGGMAVTPQGVPCCPAPYGGGPCTQNYALPSGWADQLTKGTDEDFAQWLFEEFGTAAALCYTCGGWGAPTPLCAGAAFKWDNTTACKPNNAK